MCWADRIGLLLAVLALFATLVLTANPPQGAAPWTDLLWTLEGSFVLPAWLFLRFLDMLAGGPARRRVAHPASYPSTPGFDAPPRPPEAPVLAMPSWAAGTYEYVTTGLAGLLQVLVGMGAIAVVGAAAILVAVSLGVIH